MGSKGIAIARGNRQVYCLAAPLVGSQRWIEWTQAEPMAASW